MQQLRIILFLFTGFFCACRNDEKKQTAQPDKSFSEILDSARNRSYSPIEKLHFALRVDSMAIVVGDKKQHLELTNTIAEIYFDLDSIEKAGSYFRLAVNLAREMDDRNSLGIALNNTGLIYYEMAAFDSALIYYLRANKIFREDKDSLRYAQGLVNIAIVYKDQGNYEPAFSSALDGAQILERLGRQRDLSDAYTTLGNILKSVYDFTNALAWHYKALQLRVAAHDSANIAGSLSNIGTVHRDAKEYEKALGFYFQALAIKEKSGRKKSTASTVDNIAETYLELQQYTKAEKYFEKALDLREAFADKDGFLLTAHRLCNLYLRTNNLLKAQQLALKADSLLPSIGYTKQRLENALILSRIYRLSGRYELASRYADAALVLKDSVFSKNMADAVSKMNAQFQTAQKENQIRQEHRVQLLQSSRLHIQGQYISILVVLLVVLITLLILLYRSNLDRKRKKETIELLMADQSHRIKNSLQLITDMLSLQMHAAADKEHKAIIQAALNRVGSISVIHGLLSRQGYNRAVNMKAFLNELAANLSEAYKGRSQLFEITTGIQDISLMADQALPVGLIINEWMTNLFKYANTNLEKPSITISFSRDNNEYTLSITDNCGYWDIEASKIKNKGFGLALIETLVAQLQGTSHVKNNMNGTLYTIWFHL